jgi:hypothetical protein
MTFKNVAGLKYFGMPARNENNILQNNQKLFKFEKMPVIAKFSFFLLLPITKQNFYLFFHMQTKLNFRMYHGTW